MNSKLSLSERVAAASDAQVVIDLQRLARSVSYFKSAYAREVFLCDVAERLNHRIRAISRSEEERHVIEIAQVLVHCDDTSALYRTALRDLRTAVAFLEEYEQQSP